MKIAITATQPSLTAPFEPRFGRCAYFVVIDSQTKDWQSVPNPGINSRGGAGTQAAQSVVNLGVEAVISGKFGPNAFAVLQAAGVRTYETQQGTPETLLESFLAEKLSEVKAPTSPGLHSGRGR
jgi:predicted Fe-Mo cluster-binding NifX family protein